MNSDKLKERQVNVKSVNERQSASAVANLYMWQRMEGQTDSTAADIMLCTFALNVLAEKLQKHHIDVNAIDNEVERELCDEVSCRVEKSANVQNALVERLNNVSSETVKENSENTKSTTSINAISNSNFTSQEESKQELKQELREKHEAKSVSETLNFVWNKSSTPEKTFAEPDTKESKQSEENKETCSEQLDECKEEEERMIVDEHIDVTECNVPEFTSQIETEVMSQSKEKIAHMLYYPQENQEMENASLGDGGESGSSHEKEEFEHNSENENVNANENKTMATESSNTDTVQSFVMRRLESRVAESTGLSLSPLPKVSQGDRSIMKESSSVPQHSTRKRSKATRSVPPLLTASRQRGLSIANSKKNRTEKQTHDNMFPLPQSISFQTEQSFVHENFNKDTKPKVESNRSTSFKRLGTLTDYAKLNENNSSIDNTCSNWNYLPSQLQEGSVCYSNMHSRSVSPQPVPVSTTSMTTRSISHTNAFNKSHSLCKTENISDCSSNTNNYHGKNDCATLQQEKSQRQHEHVEHVTTNSKSRTKKAKVNIIKRNIEMTKSKHKNVEPNEFALPLRLTSILSELPITTIARSETLQSFNEGNEHTLHKHDQAHEQRHKEKRATISRKTKKDKNHKK